MKFSLMSYTMWPVMNSDQMSLFDMMKFAKEQGFDAIEFSIADLDRACEDEIKQALSTLELGVSCINGTFSLAARSQEKFEDSVQAAKNMVDVARKYQCDRVMYVPALLQDIEGYEDKPRAAARIAEALREIVAYADERQVVVTVEDFPRLVYPLGTIQEIQYILDNVPGLKLTLDNGNFYPAGEDVLEAYEKFKDVIYNVHLKDWEPSTNPNDILCHDGKYIRGGSHGKGLLDQESLLLRLKNDGYPYYCAFEYEGVLDHAEETKKGIRYIKDIINW